MKTTMNRILQVMMLTILFFISGSCKKDKEITCYLATASDQAPVEMNIVYKAIQTGDGVINSVTYATTTGMVTIQNPALPWEITVPVISSTQVTISATGTTKNGSLTISYEGSSGGSTIAGSDMCSQASN